MADASSPPHIGYLLPASQRLTFYTIASPNKQSDKVIPMEQNLLTAISSVGFPIVVTLYLLTSFQRSMDRFTDQISELVKELQQQRHMIH